MLTEQKMYRALLKRDKSFEGIFFVGVKTTGIFCRPTCRARKPLRKNVEFFKDTRAALTHGYRPCKMCEPMVQAGETPAWMKDVLKLAVKDPAQRIGDVFLRKRGIDPVRVRRWFKKNHGMTFQAYLRSLRLGQAAGHLTKGGKVIDAAFSHGYESLSGFTDAFKKLTGKAPVVSKSGEVIHLHQIETPLGPMIAGAVKEGVCLLEFTDRRMLETHFKNLQKAFKAPLITSRVPVIERLEKQLGEYFASKRRDFDIPLAVPGTLFQKKVWEVLQEIEFGKTRSYLEQARAVGNPQAVRAVARANGMNRVCILIPCHRVIGSNGELTGYGGGIWRKKFLLELETR